MATAVNWLDLDTVLDCLSKLTLRCQCDLSKSKSASNDCGITVIRIPPNKLGAGSSVLMCCSMSYSNRSHSLYSSFRNFFPVICFVKKANICTHLLCKYWTVTCWEQHFNGNTDNQGQNEMWALLFHPVRDAILYMCREYLKLDSVFCAEPQSMQRHPLCGGRLALSDKL